MEHLLAWLDIIKETLVLSGFVLIMMLLVEYFTVLTHGKWNNKISSMPFVQVLFGGLLGLIPGCAGGFLAVSLYTHRIIGFAALVAVMISSTGDEAFMIFALIPHKAIQLSLLVFGISILAGFIIQLLIKYKILSLSLNSHGHVVHEAPDCFIFSKKRIIPQLKNCSFPRALLLAGNFLFLFFILYEDLSKSSIDFEHIIFMFSALIALFIVATVPEHFLKEHLWAHVIKKHLLKIFAWTLGAFILIHLVMPVIDVKSMVQTYPWLILLIALLIGVIPESGPHIVFIQLFASGLIPFSVLVANSIVQDGHSALPLLAESRRGFFTMKITNVIVGLITGLIGMLMGW